MATSRGPRLTSATKSATAVTRATCWKVTPPCPVSPLQREPPPGISLFPTAEVRRDWSDISIKVPVALKCKKHLKHWFNADLVSIRELEHFSKWGAKTRISGKIPLCDVIKGIDTSLIHLLAWVHIVFVLFQTCSGYNKASFFFS